jgi:shikimate kinase
MIVLLGYMGSGKTAVSQFIAAKLGKKAVDLDDVITQQENRSIADIFENKGAIYFRKREREALESVLQDEQIDILSLGGGTPCYYNNMELITQNRSLKSYYLQASVPELTKRLFPELIKRPILHGLSTQEQLAEFVGKHLFERAVFYTNAHNTIRTDGKTPEFIAQEIITTLF